VIQLEIPQPQGMVFADWAAVAAEQLAQYGVSGSSSDDWKTWAYALFYVPELTARNIPSPDGFPDWTSWASRFVESVR
jgi:hypothetical protein